jgi:hypothetical protein
MAKTPAKSNRLRASNEEAQAREEDRHKQKAESDRRYKEVLQLFEASWYVLKQAIRVPKDSERMPADKARIAAAIESLATRAKAARFDERIRKSAKQADDVLEKSKSQGEVGHKKRDVADLLWLLVDVMDNPGSAKTLIEDLELRENPTSVVIACKSLVMRPRRPKRHVAAKQGALVRAAHACSASGTGIADSNSC